MLKRAQELLKNKRFQPEVTCEKNFMTRFVYLVIQICELWHLYGQKGPNEQLRQILGTLGYMSEVKGA